MSLPFDREAFLSVFVAENESLWLPALGIALAVLAVAGALASRRHPRAGAVAAAALALQWILSGVAYHWLSFSPIAPLAWVFGAAFVGQGLWILAEARAGRFAFAPGRDLDGRLGTALVAVALVGYPLLGTAIGHRFPAVPVIGSAPCPTVILSLGLFLWTEPSLRRGLLVVPAAWGLVGLSAALLLGMVEDLALFGAAAIAVPVLAFRAPRRLAPRLGAAVLALGLLAAVAPSPAAASEELRVGGAGFFMAGSRQLDVSSLGTSLDHAGYTRPGSAFAELGGGGQAYLGRFILGGEGHGFFALGDDPRRSGVEGRLSGGYGLARAGYTVVRTERFVLYPLVGVGGGGVNLELDSAGRGSFDEILANGGQTTTLSTGGLLLDGGFGAEWRLPFAEDEDGGAFGLVGLRAGWTFAPLAGDWTLSGRDVRGGPDLGIEGPYVQLMLGFGGGAR